LKIAPSQSIPKIGFYYEGLFYSSRASFACVTQNPLLGFCLPGKLDGDSAPHTLGSSAFI